jgi:glycosyltransferase involved in cell wall biosynthesis
MPDVVAGLVSTIIPVYNRPAMLRQAVDSVMSQTWRPIEIIIADDGSTDETVEVGKHYEQAHPGVVRYLWNPNRGAGLARESGRQIARGEFIQYLDSDDTLWPRKFEVQVAALRANPECGVAYGQVRLCREGEPPAETPHKWTGRSLPTLFPWLLVDRWWNTDTPLWRRSVCEEIGPWSDLRYSQDWEYDARAGSLGVKLAYCPEFVCDQGHHALHRQTGSGKWLDPKGRVKFFTLLFEHALKAGVALDSPEMKHFSRWVFAHARQCGALGDSDSARALVELASKSAGGQTMDMRAYRILSAAIGWRNTSRVAELGQRLLGRRHGQSTRKQSWMT